MLGRVIIRWVITSIAVAVAVLLVPGIAVGSNAAFAVIAMAAILGLVNAFLRPILSLLSCGLIVATLGLFTLVINAGTLLLSSWIAQNWLFVDFSVNGFWPAFWGAIIISVVSFLLSIFVKDSDD
ncbi:MAG: phage holin family protein [Coriobacteriia bacterium]|nr:phage holin family protein [Coriobacteriia bacterium]